MTEWHEGNNRTQGQKPGKLVRPRIRLAACLALCAAIVVAAGLLAGCGSETQKEASKAVQTMLEDRFEAMNAGDTQTVARCYAVNAAIDNYADDTHIQGATAIAGYFAGVLEEYRMQWKTEGDPIQYDEYVIQSVSMSQLNGTGTGAAVHVLDVDANGQIVHEWVIGWAK